MGWAHLQTVYLALGTDGMHVAKVLGSALGALLLRVSLKHRPQSASELGAFDSLNFKDYTSKGPVTTGPL